MGGKQRKGEDVRSWHLSSESLDFNVFGTFAFLRTFTFLNGFLYIPLRGRGDGRNKGQWMGKNFDQDVTHNIVSSYRNLNHRPLLKIGVDVF